MSLTLSLSGLSVELKDFPDGEYPRIAIDSQNAQVEFSILGTSSIQGPAYPLRYMWSINAICTPEQRNLIMAIATEFHELRRKLLDYDILLVDKTAPLLEKTKSRAVAPGSTEESVSGYSKYFATFKTALTGFPTLTKNGVVDFVSFTLTETVLSA
jgi:hypothetical protein